MDGRSSVISSIHAERGAQRPAAMKEIGADGPFGYPQDLGDLVVTEPFDIEHRDGDPLAFREGGERPVDPFAEHRAFGLDIRSRRRAGPVVGELLRLPDL